MLWISTSNGIFRMDAAGNTQNILARKKKRWGLFGQASYGFFGIARHGTRLLAASRERLKTRRAGKHSSDVNIYSIDLCGTDITVAAEAYDVHDVHQIAVWNFLLFLTDTGKNRVGVLDMKSGEIVHWMVFGNTRDDVNHINALNVAGDELRIGLNNRGSKDAEVMTFDLGLLDDAGRELDAYEYSKIAVLEGCTHTHDIEPFDGTWLICLSHDGKIVRLDTGEPIFQKACWVRGLSQSDSSLFVGASQLAERSRRHDEGVDGTVIVINKADLQVTSEIVLSGAGQVNDLVWVE